MLPSTATTSPRRGSASSPTTARITSSATTRRTRSATAGSARSTSRCAARASRSARGRATRLHEERRPRRTPSRRARRRHRSCARRSTARCRCRRSPCAAFAAPFKGAAPNASVAVGVEAEGADLAFQQKDGKFVNDLELSVIAIDANAKLRDGTRDVRQHGPQARHARARRADRHPDAVAPEAAPGPLPAADRGPRDRRRPCRVGHLRSRGARLHEGAAHDERHRGGGGLRPGA